MNAVAVISVIAAAYLVGSIPFGLLLGWVKGVDIRRAGSGNIGATNVGRLLGVRWGLLAFALDAAKGAVPVVVSGRILHAVAPPLSESVVWWLYPAWFAVGAACVAGHVMPIYLRLRGGKGAATALGVALGYWPMFTITGLLAALVFGVVLLATRYVSLASMTAATCFPLLFFAVRTRIDPPPGQTVYLVPFAILVPVMIVARHRSNIRRLLRGEEPRIGRRKLSDTDSPSS